MEITTLYVASGLLGGLLLLVVLALTQRVRDWPFPVRTTVFDVHRDPDVAERATSRGPSGAAEGEAEAEPVEREDHSLWGRMKRGLYTYQKRPKKVR
ncbi:MAG: hypothetical protein ABEJ77_02825 [Halanaeroarchaeum sp.]